MSLLSMLIVAMGSAQAAEPIFVPDFTYGTANEFQVAVMVQGMVTDRLLQDGHIVLTNDVVAPVTGAEVITNCSVRADCPSAALPQLPTKVAVVTRVDRVGGNLLGHVELYEQSSAGPIDVRDVPIVAGNEHLFANEVSAATAELLAKVGPSPDTVLMAAARLIAGQPPAAVPAPAPVVPVVPAPVPAGPMGQPPGPTPMPTPMPGPVPMTQGPMAGQPMPGQPAPGQPAPVGPTGQRPVPAGPAAAGVPSYQPRRYDGSTPHEGSLEPILEGTGIGKRHMIGLEQNFRKSGLDPRDWLFRSMSHSGRFTAEIRAGLGIGDTDRWAAMRVVSSADGSQNATYLESPSPARRPQGSIYIGYAPAAMIDLGVVAGLQWGNRRTSTGVFQTDANGDLLREPSISEEQEVQAVQLLLQPRVRGYLVPMGPAKPFLFTGAEFRVFNNYLVDQPPNIIYLPPPGGMVPGWVGGGGLLIDPSPIVGLFAEGSYTAHLGSRAGVTAPDPATGVSPWDAERYPLPDAPAYAKYTVAITGGVQFRL